MHFGYHVHDLRNRQFNNYLTMNQTKSVNAKKIICLIIHAAFRLTSQEHRMKA